MHRSEGSIYKKLMQSNVVSKLEGVEIVSKNPPQRTAQNGHNIYLLFNRIRNLSAAKGGVIGY
ncbi:MAG: hypothetical protein KJ799_02145 [Bacteroidetes bacterium]|nr:hypothetical protein [Bacteroidota bacterium]MBU1677772.1 hypothetical protein [Bacteroidota bacterium]MBU2505511.1 hypothetical protein [Bacteroidota bacterium]